MENQNPQATIQQSIISEQPSTRPGTSKLFILLIVILLLSTLGVGTYLLISHSARKDTGVPNNSSLNIPEKTNLSGKQWINCSDIRDVIRDNNTIYVACLGGVLHVDTTTNNVIDQISMTQGLGNFTVTNIIKKGNILYIGTQDGFTKYDLVKKQGEKISVGQGLVNGANIYLADDSNDIWIGTFDGVSKYNTATGKITNYRTELADNSTQYDVQKIIVTQKAVYVTVIANTYSPGSIARFDKATQTWERFGPASFKKTGQYGRIDFFQIAYVDGKIYASNSTDGGSIWVGDDQLGSTWTEDTNLNSTLGTQAINNLLLGNNGNNLIIYTNNVVYSYNTIDKTLSSLWPSQQKDTQSSNDRVINEDQGSIWISGVTDSQWLTSFNLNTKQQASYAYTNRPESFNSILAVVDNMPLIGSGNSLWVYSTKNAFKKLVTFDNNDLGNGPSGLVLFQPIQNTPNILVFNQSCGEGCGEPQIALYNYLSNSIQLLTLPQDVLSKIRSGTGNNFNYQSMDFVAYNSQSNKVTFSIGDNFQAIFTVSTGVWQILSMLSPTSGETISNQNNIIQCNRSYTFAVNGNTFKSVDCPKLVENADYTWTIGNPQSSVLQTKKSTNQQTSLNIPATSPIYSPFPNEKSTVTITSMMYFNNVLWVGTDRGLGIYDPLNSSWKTLSTVDGLPSNDISNFIVNQNSVWILTNAGLSSIQYK